MSAEEVKSDMAKKVFIVDQSDAGEAFCKGPLWNRLWKLTRRDPKKERPGLMSFLSHTCVQ